MPKKIIHLSRLFSPHLGGVEVHVREVARIQVQRGWAVTVLTEQHQQGLPLEETSAGIKIIRIPHRIAGRKLPVWRWMWRHRGLLAEADRIHVHDVFWWLLPVFSILGGEIITTFHGWETRFPVRMSAKLQRWIYARLSGKTVHVGRWIRDYYWDKPDAVTFGGVRQEFLKAELPKQKKKTQLNIIFLGRLAEDTGVREYLNALEKLREKEISVAVKWIGDGPLKEECKQFGRVFGTVRNLLPHLQKADLVFASSYLSILEAQALGKPVAALYHNSLKEAYLRSYPGAFAMLIAGSGEELAEKLAELVETEKKQAELAEKSRRFAGSQTWEKVADMYEKLTSN